MTMLEKLETAVRMAKAGELLRRARSLWTHEPQANVVERALERRIMTLADINEICCLLKAAGRTHVPVSISEWREYMATKTIGNVSKAELAKGKVKPDSKTPKHFKIAKEAKASTAARKWAAKSK